MPTPNLEIARSYVFLPAPSTSIMTVSAYVLSLALLTSSHLDQEPPSFTVEDLLHQPFVELLAQSLEGYSLSDLKALRSRVEKERDQQLEELAKRQKMWEGRLDSARDELESLNSMASRDTEAAALRRSNLHAEIAALERSIREKAIERERTMPAKYEYQLTRLWLAEHWPGRRREILQQISEGEARTRRHGDADDIGYRQLVKNPEQDIETGQQAARQMTAGGWLPPEVQDSEVQAYIRQVAARIAANSDLKVPLRVTVLDSNEPKAMSLPGGFLYITSGAMRTARTESELAGVLAREIARIAARHGTRSSKLSWISRLFVPVTQVATGIFTSGVSPAAYYGIGYGVDGLGGWWDA